MSGLRIRGARPADGEAVAALCARLARLQGGRYGYWQILESNAPAIAFYAPIAVEDRSVLRCTLEGERFRALAAAAPAVASDG